jgi:hypothetical protein
MQGAEGCRLHSCYAGQQGAALDYAGQPSPKTGGRVLAVGCWMLDAGCWMLDAGCWMLDAGCWLLAARCWLLAAGVAHHVGRLKAAHMIGAAWDLPAWHYFKRGTTTMRNPFPL